jgi:FemAB-related protein (PEP-CTERM system-associated)
VTVRLADLSSAGDRARIEGLIAAHRLATPFHTLAWIEAVAKGCGQRAHVLLAENAVLPLNEIHSPIFGRALVSSGFAVGGGILAEDQAGANALADAAWALAQRLHCPTLELRGAMLPTGWDADHATYLGFTRDLAADDEAELLAIPRKQRAEVRKAIGNELTIDIGDRAAHYAVYATSVRNLGTPVFPRALFDAVLDAFGDDADVLTVRKDGVPLASVLSLYWRGTVMPYWGGGVAAARPARANDMMYFALMRHAREKGCTRFDFGRSKAGTGPAAFKHNWGFEGVPLSYAKRAAGKARSINPLDAQYSRKVDLWKKLPLAVANRIGPMIARGLG